MNRIKILPEFVIASRTRVIGMIALATLITLAAWPAPSMAQQVKRFALPNSQEMSKRLVRLEPTPAHVTGAVELLAVTGANSRTFDASKWWRRITPDQGSQSSQSDRANAFAVAAWHSLPVTPSTRRAFDKHVDAIAKSDARHEWLPVYRLIQALLENDRDALLKAAAMQRGVKVFPSVFAESSQLQVLQAIGIDKVSAGMHVLQNRRFGSLYALMDLDRHLSREGTYLRSVGQDNDADKLIAARDLLRNAYLEASRHVVEKMFALNLLGRSQERQGLLHRYETYTKAMQSVAFTTQQLRGMDDQHLWSLLVEPALTGDLNALDRTREVTLALKDRAATRLRIEAGSKQASGGATIYTTNVTIAVDQLTIRCSRAVVKSRQRDDGQTSVRIVADNAAIEAPWGSASADRLSFDARGAQLSFEGNVSVKHGIWPKAKQYTSAVLSINGNVHRTRSLIDEFDAAADTDGKLALLPRMDEVYDDDALPAEAKLLRALQLIEPHLNWHVPHALPNGELKIRRDLERLSRESWQDHRWEQALGAEPWMKVPDAVRQATLALLAKRSDDANETNPAAAKRNKADALKRIHWRLKAVGHADVKRAKALLNQIKSGKFSAKARRWADEIRRNNTVLTLDVSGGMAKGKEGAVVLDVRGTDEVSFKLYRVRKLSDLRSVHQRIGEHFIYREYGSMRVQHGHFNQIMEQLAEQIAVEQHLDRRLPLPALAANDRMHQSVEKVADLKWLGLIGDVEREYEYEETSALDDSEYFDDDHFMFRRRLKKSYRPDNHDELSTWRTDRVVTIPAAALAESGAYIFVAEANGQRAFAPIIVDPLSLTLRRARDGVMVAVSDSTGDEAVSRATVLSSDNDVTSTTNDDGVAFHRVLATGKNAILVEKDGRFGVGGFGRVFDGVYRSVWDRARLVRQRFARELKKQIERDAAHLYADRHVIAAYTDRPTYRPGQAVKFKLIVRQLKNRGDAPKNDGRFREVDFDVEKQFELPKAKENVSWSLLNPRGRAVLSGNGELNEFGTLVDEGQLNSEAMTGVYSLRVSIDGLDRIVPEVLQVKHYRRPNFKVTVDGLPEQVEKRAELMINVAGRYYFGEPLVGGAIDIRLVRPDHWRPLAQVDGKLGVTGLAALRLTLPPNLQDGEYAVITTLSDESGRSVSDSHALKVGDGDIDINVALLLPRFVNTGESIDIQVDTANVKARYLGNSDADAQVVAVTNGKANIHLREAGWHEITIGDSTSHVFAYSDTSEKSLSVPWRLPSELREKHGFQGFVDLSDFAMEAQQGIDRLMRDGHEVHALFDRQHAKVGGTIRMLIRTRLPRARVLFTLEGRTVVDYHVSNASPEAKHFRVVELPVRARSTPNVYVQGRVMAGAIDQLNDEVEAEEEKQLAALKDDDSRDGSLDPRWCRVEVIDPNRKSNGQELNVSVKTDKQTYRPGEEVAVQVNVTDNKGQPIAAELSLAAVDASIYHFGEDQLDQLPRAFGSAMVERRYQPKAWRSSIGARWSTLRQVDALSHQKRALESMAKSVDRLLAIEKRLASNLSTQRRSPLPLTLLRGEMPVGRVAMARLRLDFRETAAWLPQVRTDANGLAKATFKLPDSLTEWRVNAVSVTKGTAIGVGRSAFRSNLPLSVQLFTPRFAIEKDRQQVVALIHNNSGAERSVQVRWDITGGNVVEPLPQGWTIERDADNETTVIQATVKAASGKATRTAFNLTFHDTSDVRIRCRVVDVNDKSFADAEQRDLQVHPLGRPGKHEYSDSFKGEKRIELPAGFLIEDLRITVSRDGVPMALEGLDYLANYPHGCVEQTMSRFLPLVMLRDASQQETVGITEKTKAELPAMLSKGLARLYKFQHDDGSWGWFNEQQPDDAMTAYVMYGLVRCRATGVEVDENVMQRGLAFLAKRWKQQSMAAEPAARVAYVLALAGKSDQVLLRAVIGKAVADISNKTTGRQRCNLALVSLATGMNEQAQQLWRRAYLWQPKSTADLALKLRCMVAFGDSLDDCRDTAQRILANRRGHRWYHTRDTSWAIESLSELLRFTPNFEAEQPLTVRLEGRVLFDGKLAVREVKPHRIHLKRSDIKREGETIVLKSEGDDPVHYSITVTGTQRLDQVKPSGRLLTLRRQYTTLDGKPIAGPIRQGEVIAVRLISESAVGQSYVMIEDFKPAGFEFADEQWRGPSAALCVHTNFRDDRVSAFVRNLKAGQHEWVYYLRAETVGLSHVLPGRMFPMYNERNRGETGADRLEITFAPE